jgi:hypothetical protein
MSCSAKELYVREGGIAESVDRVVDAVAEQLSCGEARE